MEFLINFCNELYEIFELRDGSNYFEECYEIWAYNQSDPPVPPTNDFEENVTRSMTPEVRINLTKIKMKAFDYYCKAITVIKMNFEDHIKTHCPDAPIPINPFFSMYNILMNSSSKPFKDKVDKFYDVINTDSFYGNNIFAEQKKCLSELRPNLKHSDSDSNLTHHNQSDLEERMN